MGYTIPERVGMSKRQIHNYNYNNSTIHRSRHSALLVHCPLVFGYGHHIAAKVAFSCTYPPCLATHTVPPFSFLTSLDAGLGYFSFLSTGVVKTRRIYWVTGLGCEKFRLGVASGSACIHLFSRSSEMGLCRLRIIMLVSFLSNWRPFLAMPMAGLAGILV